jgi:hypothetical protein
LPPLEPAIQVCGVFLFFHGLILSTLGRLRVGGHSRIYPEKPGAAE